MSDLTDLYSALDSVKSTMAVSARDWGAAPDLAWLYGIFVGWSDDPTGGDVDQGGGAMQELAARFGWSDADVERLRQLHAAVAGFDINCAADLEGAR
jgi:hypothetical protein